MRIIFIIFLAFSLSNGQVLLNENFENFRNFPQSDSIQVGFTEMGDSIGTTYLTSSFENHWYSVRPSPVLFADSVAEPYEYFDSPWVKGAHAFKTDTARAEALWLNGEYSGMHYSVDADSNKSFVIVVRNKRIIRNFASSYPFVFTKGRISGGARGWYSCMDYAGSGNYSVYNRILNGSTYDMDGVANLDTSLVPSGWFTGVYVFDRENDSAYVYINGNSVKRSALSRVRYWGYYGTSYPSIMLGLYAMPTTGYTFSDNYWHDYVEYKNVALTLQEIRQLEMPTGWKCTGDFKPYRIADGNIAEETSLYWNMGFTGSDVDNYMYYPLVLPESGIYKLNIDAYSSNSTALKCDLGGDIKNLTIGSSNKTYRLYFENQSAGSDTLKIYGLSSSDSIVVDNIKLIKSRGEFRGPGWPRWD